MLWALGACEHQGCICPRAHQRVGERAMAITLHGADPSQGLSHPAWGLPLPPPPIPLSTGQANSVPTPALAKAVCVP